MRRSKRQPAAVRQPHPDPRTEVRLKRVITLLNAVGRNEEQLDVANASITHLTEMVRKHPTWDGYRRRQDEIERLQGELARLNQENEALHDRIAELTADIDDVDLTYLDKRGAS